MLVDENMPCYGCGNDLSTNLSQQDHVDPIVRAFNARIHTYVCSAGQVVEYEPFSNSVPYVWNGNNMTQSLSNISSLPMLNMSPPLVCLKCGITAPTSHSYSVV